MKKTLREKILEILKQPTIHSNPNLFHTEKLEPILSIVREAVKERNPLTAKPIRKGQKITKRNEGYNEGVSNYHDVIMEVLS